MDRKAPKGRIIFKPSKPYKYRLAEPYSYQLPFKPAKKIILSDLVHIRPCGKLEVQPGFLWDGCSPKWSLLDLVMIGTPDGVPQASVGVPPTYYASLVHDILCEHKDRLPFSRRQRADIFYDLCTEFRLAELYHLALKWFGT